MIPRYTRPEMSKIWSDEERFRIWLKIEILALEKMVEEGLASKESLEKVKATAKFDTARVLEIEEKVKHDVIAFLTNVTESVGPAARFLHRGMTSSDVLDTALALQLKSSGELLLKGVERVLSALEKRAKEFKHTPCIGRSHGIHAEPTTFGVKLIGWYSEMRRHKERLSHAIEDISYGKISGAVGTYASVSPAVEQHVMRGLGLKAETVSTQIVPRDRHANFFCALAELGASLERFATEVRHLQRTEVREAEERFTAGQKGSSAMPHKRNPVLSENLTGLARLLRGYAVCALENVALWHERDISHSSAERVIAPDGCIVADFMLHRFAAVIEGLVVYPARMLENLELTRGLVFSGSLLLALVDKGMVREDAYALVQKHALEAYDGGPSLAERVKSDPQIQKFLSTKEVDSLFDLKNHLRHVDFIFERALA